MNRLLVSSLLLGLSLASAGASAQVSDPDRAAARSLALEGQEALDKKDFVTAVDRFTRADSIIHAPTLLLGVARAQVGLGKLVAAQESYARIAREGVPPRSPPPFAVAVSDAAKELERLGPRIPSVTIQVKGAADAAVTLDGAPVPPATLGVKRPIDPGKHRIRATAPGFAPTEVSLTVAEGRAEAVTLELKPTADPGLTTPANAGGPPPPKGDPAPVTPAKGGMSTQKILGVSALALGGAGLVLGGVTGGLALGKHGDLATACPGGACPPSQQAALDSYHLMGTLSTVGFIVGGAGLAGGAVLFFTARPGKPAGEAFVPVIGPGFVGARGAF